MELQIGKHCTEPTCKQLDFLPLSCKCGMLFCSEHFQQHIRNCSEYSDNQAIDLRKIQNVFVCSHADCKETSVVALICTKCNKHFCIKHRHVVQCEEVDPSVLAAERERYAAPIRKFNEAKDAVDKQLDTNLNEAKKKQKNRVMANKIQLMRIKNKANGSKMIPSTDRVYFNIAHPRKISDKISPVFVSKRWTLGRVIDAIAEECKLQNNNNKSGELKLRLFKSDDNRILSMNLGIGIEDLLRDGIILDGDSLVIEYVEENCEFLK